VEFLGFLRRELAPTPGRGSATFRLTLVCLIATIPVLTHRIPHALVVMIMTYLVTQEDTAATLVGSVLAEAGVTLSLGLALLAWMVALDIPWLRIGFLVVFLFGGLFLKRVLTMGALGTVLGLLAALVMIIPDIAPGSTESLVEFVLWIWLCITLGLGVNLGVQLLLAPGEPLMLLQREFDTRLHVVEETLRALAGARSFAPAASGTSLDSLALAGMSRSLALLKTASLTNARARQRHEEIAATITLADRLVTDAGALRTLVASMPGEPVRESLLRVADACARTRRALAEHRWPQPGETAARPVSVDRAAAALPPLADMERTLEQISVTGRVGIPSAMTTKETGFRLFLPDATSNPEYVQFAVKGALAALICYILFVGFDYPQIYTSVITCFVVSVSTIGSSNQKGILRFGGAALGGLMGVCALVYAFPNVEGLGGFWLVFAAGTAVAAWINFGTPRIAYGGYQTGLAFYKAILQGFGPAVSATVVRDRLIGVFFGLAVFGLVEHVLWPVRTVDRMHARLADVFRSLGAFALVSSRPRGEGSDVDARRRLISQQIADVQGFIDGWSKFDPGGGVDDAQAVERLLAETQTVFLVLLAIARDADAPAPFPDAVRAATIRLEADVAAILEGLARSVVRSGGRPSIHLDGALTALEQSIAEQRDGAGQGELYDGRLALYRELSVAVNRLASSDAAPNPVMAPAGQGPAAS